MRNKDKNSIKMTNKVVALLDSVEIDTAVLQEAKERRLPDLSDSEFAHLLGVKPATYSDYKNSKQAKPSLPVAIRASLILDLDLRSLVPNADRIQSLCAESLRSNR